MQKFKNKSMKYIFVIALGFTFLTSCNQQETKIGFINNGDLINKYQMKIDLETKYEGLNAKFTRRMDSLSQLFQAEVVEFQSKEKSMSQNQLQEVYQKLGQKQQTLQQQYQAEQQQLEQAFQTDIDSVISKVKKFVKDYGQKNNYTYILGSNETGSVMYGAESADLTETVSEALNKAYAEKN